MTDKNVDEFTGTQTTGHDWDGIKELDTPTPRWWLITWLVTIIFCIGYSFVYPTIPGVEGMFGWTQHKQLKEQQAEILARKAKYSQRFKEASLEEIRSDQELFVFAKAGGAAAFKRNCATCHGAGAQGAVGYPNLNDDDWLWGGALNEIYDTIKFGIRSGHDEERMSEMSAFGRDELLEPEEITEVAGYVLSLSGKQETTENGAVLFEENCAACHGEKGEGGRDFGAPRLNDHIWLYGHSKKDIIETITNARRGIMPAWQTRLDDATIKQLAIYVHSLGGGE